MKFLTGSPAQVARLGDLVERDVESNIDIAQESFFPLRPFPFLARSQLSGGLLSTSAQFSDQLNLAASQPINFRTLWTLDRGLWRIAGSVTYQSSFTAVAGDGFRLEIVEPVTFAVIGTLARTAPLTQTQSIEFDMDFSLDRADRILQAVLGATGVGQNHTWVLGLTAMKYF